MIDYKSAGVDIEKGDQASAFAYANAKKTFASRKGMMGTPFELDGGFAGALDLGDFLVIQNDDGTGTKMEIAERMNNFETIGEDLLGCVVDDALCVGAEVISVTNTIDTNQIEPENIKKMTAGLAKACITQKIVIPGGEIAELPGALNKTIWNATAVGIVKKEKFITGKNIAPGQKIIGLKGRVLRSNGTSLARKICETNFGPDWHQKEWKNGISWGEILLTPSKIFHRLLLDTILGDFEKARPFEINGIVHITGGGIPGNIPRIFPKDKTLGASFNHLHPPHEALKDLKKLGNITDEECYRTWHSGTALMLICETKHSQNICQILNETDPEVEAQIVGEITNSKKIEIRSKFSNKTLDFER